MNLHAYPCKHCNLCVAVTRARAIRCFVYLDLGLFLPWINEDQCVELCHYKSVLSLVLDMTFEQCSVV